MLIAVASDGLDVASRYEFAQDLTCYTVSRGKIAACRNIPFPKLPITAALDVFKDLGIDVFITGTIKYDVADRFCSEGIEVIAGISGSSREAADNYLNKTLTGFEELC